MHSVLKVNDDCSVSREAAFEALRRAKKAAEPASRAKSSFVATLSHQLRTPLSAIIGCAEIIAREVFGPLENERYRACVSDIHRSSLRLLQIVNEVFELSKAEAGKLELDETIFDLGETIRVVHRLLGARFCAAGLTVALDLPADLPLLRGDERKTRQVLLNLVVNAVTFTPRGGHIAIAARFDPAEGLVMTISDSGIGIAPDDLDRVLEPFEQVPSACNRLQPGSGLGLPLVKAIIERHGGALGLTSDLGSGTRASVTFPPQRAVFDHPVRDHLLPLLL